MFRLFKDSFFSLVTVFFASFFASYFVTVNYQIFVIHRKLIVDRSVGQISFGIITLVIFALLPIMLWKMVEDSEIPLFKSTKSFRLALSYIEMAYTASLFVSKSIFNSIAKGVMSWESDLIFDAKGRTMLIEVFSIGIPAILFLWLTKKIISYFMRDNNELEA